MSNNNNPPAGGNNINNKKKRKYNTISVPTEEEISGQKKRRTDPQPGSSPAVGPPAQPGFGNPTNPSDHAPVPMPTLYAGSQPGFPPFATTSTAFAPQYPHPQAQPQWPQQQQPQHVPPPGGYHPDSNMGFAAGQHQVTPQAPTNPQYADSSPEKVEKPPIEFYEPEDSFVTDNPGDGSVPKIEHKDDPNKTNIIFKTSDPKTTISRSCGDRFQDVIKAQYDHLESIHGPSFDYVMNITVRPLMSGPGPKIQLVNLSQSSQPLVSTKKDGRRRDPGTDPVQAPAQGQEHNSCPNCGREGHLVGDCVGPPNPIHGDLPACPVCDTFAGRAKNLTSSPGHRFDDCPEVDTVFYNHHWDKDRRLVFEELASLTDNQLLFFFNALVVKRLRKTPIRTQLVCWIDVLREVARRAPGSEAIHSLGNMTPWTKDFAKQQRDSAAQLAKPWELYNYADRNTLTLPACPVAQIGTTWEDFVADGFPQFPPQVFNSKDRSRPSEKVEIDRSSAANSPQSQEPPQTPSLFAHRQPSQTASPGLGARPRSFGDDVSPVRPRAIDSWSPNQFNSASAALDTRPELFSTRPISRLGASSSLWSPAAAASAHRPSTTAPQPGLNMVSKGPSSRSANTLDTDRVFTERVSSALLGRPPNTAPRHTDSAGME